MAKDSKLTKLRSAIKKWQSMSKISRTNSTSSASISPPSPSDEERHSLSGEKIPGGLHTVYVGKSRRRYFISSDIIDHPLVRELVDRSGGSDAITVGCEVVMFEHLLWMLQNGEPQAESAMDELVEFYAC